MKSVIRWPLLAAAMIVLISTTSGCASSRVYKYASGGQGKQFLLFSDEIFAIGRPDADLAKKLGREHVVAFLGRKHTYLLHKGGEELEHIAQLNVDKQSIKLIGAGPPSKLSFKDNAVWGQVTLSHRVKYDRTIGSPNATIPDEEKDELKELERAGFVPQYGRSNSRPEWYLKTVDVEGIAREPLQLSQEQMDSLTVQRTVYFYTSSESDSNIARKVTGALLMPGALLLDVAFAAVPILGFYGVVLSSP